MSKLTYNSSIIDIFPYGFEMVLPDGYQIDIEYDDDWNKAYHLRGGFYTNDYGEEDFAFSAGFIGLNTNLTLKEGADPKALKNIHDPSHPDYVFNQIAEGVMQTLEDQFGHGKILKLYKSTPAAAIMKFHNSMSLMGVGYDTESLFCWIQVSDNTVLGLNSVHINDSGGAGDYYKHLLNVIKSIQVNGKPIDTGKLTPKKLEKALDMYTTIDYLDLGLSVGDNKKTNTGKKKSATKSVTAELTYAIPDKSLYPHYDHLMNAAPKIPGTIVVVNPGGTEYAFYGLREAADQEENFSSEMRTLFKRIVSKDPGDYALDKEAREMAGVFHVDKALYDMSNDREAELVNGYMKRAYMFSAIRSFAWTLSDYCGKKKKLPDQVSYKELSEIVKFIAKRDWLNYDSGTYSKGLCTGSDLHVYYVPDAVSQDDKEKLLPAQEDYDRVMTMKDISPSYNEILPEVQSLDALRGSLKFIYPPVKTIYDKLAQKRKTSKPLEGNEADIVYAWCALAMAAKEPFFTEDGPMTYYLSQPESTFRGPDDKQKTPEKEDYQLDAHKFISIIKSLYDTENTDDIEAAVNTAFKDAFKNPDTFANCRSYLLEEAKEQSVPFVAEMLDAETDDEAVFTEMPSHLVENIIKTREEKIEAENTVKYDKSQKFFESNDLKKISKAEAGFIELGDYRDSKEKAQLCKDKAERIRESKYEEAELKAEEGSEKSLERAIAIMEGLGSYKEAADKADEYRKTLDLERKYETAKKLLEREELPATTRAQEMFESLGGYKDSEKQNETCKDRIETMQSGIYEDAMSLAEEGTIESMEAAIAKLEPIAQYRDSDDIVVRLYRQVRNERIYVKALETASGENLSSLKEAIKKLELLDNYKDSEEKKAEYERQIESICREKYEEAKEKEKVLSVEAQREAKNLYTEADGWGDSSDCIDGCDKNIAAIKEAITLNHVLGECNAELVKTKGDKWKKPIQSLINEKEKQFNEIKHTLAQVADTNHITISENGLTEAELNSLKAPSAELEDIRKANEKGRKSVKWRNIIIVVFLIVLVIGIASMVINVSTDLSKYEDVDEYNIHGMTYEIPVGWEMDTNISNDTYNYYTLKKNKEIIAVTTVSYKGDEDLSGAAGYNKYGDSNQIPPKVKENIPDAEGRYQTVKADYSIFKVALYCNPEKVENSDAYLSSLCDSFRTYEYENPRRFLNVTVRYTGDTSEGVVLDKNNEGIEVAEVFNTGSKTGSKESDEWEVKKPVTLKAGETSRLTVIVDGKEYSVDITCSTKPEDSKENKDSKDSEEDTEKSDNGESEATTGRQIGSTGGATASGSYYRKEY